MPAESPSADVGGARQRRRERRPRRLLASVDFDASPRSRDFLRHVVEESDGWPGGAAEPGLDRPAGLQAAGRLRSWPRPDRPHPGGAPAALARALLPALGQRRPRADRAAPGRLRPGPAMGDARRAADPASDARARGRRTTGTTGPSSWSRPSEAPRRRRRRRLSSARSSRPSSAATRTCTSSSAAGAADADRPAGRGAHFALGGAVREVDGRQRVSVRLVDLADGPPDLGGRVPAGRSSRPHARVRRNRRAGDRGARRVRAGDRRPHPRGGAPAASARRAGTVRRAAAVLPLPAHARAPQSSARPSRPFVRAVSQDPAFGLAWTQLGRLYAVNYAFERGADRHADRGGREPGGEGRAPRADEPPGPGDPRHGPALRGGDRRRLGSRRSARSPSARRRSCTSTCSAGS